MDNNAVLRIDCIKKGIDCSWNFLIDWRFSYDLTPFFNGNITLFWKITSKHFFGALKLARFRKTCLSCPKQFNDFELLPSFSLVVNVNLFYYQIIQLQIFVMNFCNFTPIESEFNSSKSCLQGWSLILEKGYMNPHSLPTSSLPTSYMYRIHDILALFL